jgi:outer membrane lipopolysaccharide assembly protein LptE/RlpB
VSKTNSLTSFRDAGRAAAGRPKRIFGRALLALAAVGLAAACGYNLQGTGVFLPPHIRTVAIPVFKNLTTRFELDVKLTQSVITEFVARGKVSIVTDTEAADAVLSGEITNFSANPIAFSGQAPDRYEIRIESKFTLRDRVNQKVLFSNPSFVHVQEYEVPQGTDFESVETEAIDKVAPRFARSLVLSMLEGF